MPTPGPTQDLPELDAWLEEQRVANGLIGLAAVVSGPDGLAWSGGAGWEDMDHAIRIPE